MDAGRARLERLLDGARRIADAGSELGRRARAELRATTGLSSAGIELALAECLELRPSEAELELLTASVEPAPVAHVLLSANVFTAAHRALALALASSRVVKARPSRREPAMARLLAEAAPDLFEIVDELRPAPGDACWAYGSDETLASVRRSLPEGVRFFGHGSGFGVAVVSGVEATPETARELARDIVPFDQRGCLSPRVALFDGDSERASGFAELVARELGVLEAEVPLGRLDRDEAAKVTLFRDARAYAGALFEAGGGWVSAGESPGLLLAPVGRNLHVEPCRDPWSKLEPVQRHLAALGLATAPELGRSLGERLPGARTSRLGLMQRPPFDGPVDRRPSR